MVHQVNCCPIGSLQSSRHSATPIVEPPYLLPAPLNGNGGAGLDENLPGLIGSCQARGLCEGPH